MRTLVNANGIGVSFTPEATPRAFYVKRSGGFEPGATLTEPWLGAVREKCGGSSTDENPAMGDGPSVGPTGAVISSLCARPSVPEPGLVEGAAGDDGGNCVAGACARP